MRRIAHCPHQFEFDMGKKEKKGKKRKQRDDRLPQKNIKSRPKSGVDHPPPRRRRRPPPREWSHAPPQSAAERKDRERQNADGPVHDSMSHVSDGHLL